MMTSGDDRNSIVSAFTWLVPLLPGGVPVISVAAYWAEHALFGTNFVGRQFMERLFGFMPHAFHPHAGPLRLQGATVGTASATDRFLGSGSVARGQQLVLVPNSNQVRRIFDVYSDR